VFAGRRGVQTGVLLLGIDGGATKSRARLADRSGRTLSEAAGGPASLRFGPEEAFTAIRACAATCFARAGLCGREGDTIACLALAAATEPGLLAAARAHPHPFRRAILASDAEAACIGAHAGADGGVVVVGTGSIGWAMLGSAAHRVGGWGFPLSDEGSGAWIGAEAIRRALRAHDGLTGWTPFLARVFERFGSDPHAVVRWMGEARPRDFAEIAPIAVAFAHAGDGQARVLVRAAAGSIGRILRQLKALAAPRLALVGGLAGSLEPFLSPAVRSELVAPRGDALSGALLLAQRELERGALQPCGARRG
jgi:glucosamine kinase